MLLFFLCNIEIEMDAAFVHSDSRRYDHLAVGNCLCQGSMQFLKKSSIFPQ